jgi:hypothetical protein
MESDEYGAVRDMVLGNTGNESNKAGAGEFTRSKKTKPKYLIFLLALLALIIAASFYLEKGTSWAGVPEKCADGTLPNKCSATRPMYCMNGALVEKASLCGCPDGYAVEQSRCVKVNRCGDGTIYGKCSTKKPLYCLDGELIPKASYCGCPEDDQVKGEACEKIKRCRDGTVYKECSPDKPLYCMDGLLVNNSQTCGCPGGYFLAGDGCISLYGESASERILPYTLRGKTSALQIAVHPSLKEYLAALPRIYYCDPKCPTPQQLELRYLEDEKQKPEILALAEKIKDLSNDPDDRVRIAISLVQNIPYDTEGAESGNLTNRYPYEVLYDHRGVCGEKSRLLAYIIRELGYGVYLLDYEKEEHMAVALKCPMEYSQYSYNGTGYCFVETTRVSIMTDNAGEYSNTGEKLTTVPMLITVRNGKEFPAGVEYADDQDWIRLNELAARSGGALQPEDYYRWKQIKEKYGIETLNESRNT